MIIKIIAGIVFFLVLGFCSLYFLGAPAFIMGFYLDHYSCEKKQFEALKKGQPYKECKEYRVN